MPNYDSTRFEPPAPLAIVTLRNPLDSSFRAEALMLLDSGADVTLLPQAAVVQLGIPLVSDSLYQLAGFDGTTSLSPVVQLDILFLGKAFRGQFLLIDREWGVIGRNLLNYLRILLDGPQLNWKEVKW